MASDNIISDAVSVLSHHTELAAAALVDAAGPQPTVAVLSKEDRRYLHRQQRKQRHLVSTGSLASELLCAKAMRRYAGVVAARGNARRTSFIRCQR